MLALVREEGVLLQERPAPLRTDLPLSPGATNPPVHRAAEVSRESRAGVALPFGNRVAPPQSGVIQNGPVLFRIARQERGPFPQQ